MNSYYLSRWIIVLFWVGIYSVTVEWVPAQNQNNYQRDWESVAMAESKGLTQDARKIVRQIYAKAKAANEPLQAVKSLLYEARYNQTLEDQVAWDSLLFARFETEINANSGAVRALLQSVSAKMYWEYYNQHRWQFQQRSTTTQFEPLDVATWSLNDLTRRVCDLHRAALSDKKTLQSQKIELLKELIDSNDFDDFAKENPTVYDFLAGEALKFFSNSEARLQEPIYKFEMDDAVYLAPTAEFIAKVPALVAQSPDTQSTKRFAVEIFLELARFHLDDPVPLVNCELQRLAFAKNELVRIDNLNNRYLAALEELERRLSNHPVSARVSHQIAEWYSNQARTWNPADPNTAANRYLLLKALEICRATEAKFPNSEGAANCRALRSKILNPLLRLKTEEVFLPQKPGFFTLNFANVKKVYLRIAKATPNTDEDLSQIWDPAKKHKYYTSLKPVQTKSYDLPLAADHQTHSVELNFDALEDGSYYLMISSSPEFEFLKNTLVVSRIEVMDLAYIERTREKNYEVYVVRRSTGRPLPGATLNFTPYYKSDKYDREFTKKTFTSDSEGFITVPFPEPTSEYYYVSYRKNFSYQGRSFSAQNPLYTYQNNWGYQPTNYTACKLFLDRAIYRPGQPIYFKGIVYTSDGTGNAKVVPNEKVTVELHDVNGRTITQADFTTNEYGSFHGMFTAPVGVMTGQMTLQTPIGAQTFRVEEYKRPKFEVSFEPIKGSYRLNETITVTGNAKAYAGSNIDNAQVRYRVVRKPYFPNWCWWWAPPAVPETEIANGYTKTDAQGKFNINFQALPDAAVSSELKPAFKYNIVVDITDQAGETRSNSTNVFVGYVALSVGISVPSELDLSPESTAGKEVTLDLVTNNLSGAFEPAKGKVTFYQLIAPKYADGSPKSLRNYTAYQQITDTFLLSKSEFDKLFPHDPYLEEKNIALWPATPVGEYNFNTAENKTLKLTNTKNWKPGYYKVELITQDKYGTAVRFETRFVVLQSQQTAPPLPFGIQCYALNASGEPGQQAQFLVASAAPETWMLCEFEQRGKIIEKRRIKLTNNQQLITKTLTEDMRGGLVFRYTAISQNRFATNEIPIIVPWSNKELSIELATFRDKLLPGQAEEWKLTIKGPQKDKVAAEVLAAMYDASLDAFAGNEYNLSVWPTVMNGQFGWQTQDFQYNNGYELPGVGWQNTIGYLPRPYGQLQLFGLSLYNNQYYLRYYQREEVEMPDGAGDGDDAPAGINKKPKRSMRALEKADPAPVIAGMSKNGNGSDDESKRDRLVTETNPPNGKKDLQPSGEENTPAPVKIRTNLSETAFFLPQLQTDAAGDVILKFTVPEALTRWKLLAFAHTKDLKLGTKTATTVTQKDLMVLPNQPRFFRENDIMFFQAKVSNLTNQKLNGTASLEMIDALTNQPITSRFVPPANTHFNIPVTGVPSAGEPLAFTCAGGQSAPLAWKMKIPEGVYVVSYRIVVKAGNFSDGEEAPVPILTNSMLVTEALPLPVRGKQTKNFTFTKLAQNNSPTLRHHRLTLEMTSNPAWYAVQALPYLMEYPYECTEQLYSRFYANSMAGHIATSDAKIEKVFEKWRTIDKQALLSNLEKNEELKSVLLEETPWVRAATSENEQKQRIALLFDLTKMASERSSALRKLLERQRADGSFSWFPGQPGDRYMTQHIVSGLGKLNHLNIKLEESELKEQLDRALRKAVHFLDNCLEEDLRYLKRVGANLKENHLGYTQIQYLYMRSFFPEINLASGAKEAYEYYCEQAQKYWLNYNRYSQAMLSLALHRPAPLKTKITENRSKAVNEIIASLRQNAIQSEEMGMYFKEFSSAGFYWYESPIEAQAMFIEAFEEVANNPAEVEALKVWLLKNKQTNHWKTTRATAEACYALLLRGTSQPADDRLVEVTIGGQQVLAAGGSSVTAESGTGYYKTAWQPSEINAKMAEITCKKETEGVAWGAVYWQYFEQMDKITPAQTPLSLRRALAKVKDTPTGPVITPLSANETLKPGDRVQVRLELRSDRDMEYIHLKDARAAGLEPVDVISQSKLQDGLWYYQSTRDAATHFFIGFLPKGTYVFEYTLRVSHAGDFSAGLSQIQCMYAPEFTAHSQGVRVTVQPMTN